MSTNTLRRWTPLLLLSVLGAGPAAAPSASPAAAVQGEYVEARSASVFAGACHYNGERVTEGRTALLAWNIENGSFNGVDLAGTRVLAAITSKDNLAESAARQTELFVDASSDTQSAAAVAWVKSRVGDPIGQVSAVRRTPVTFQKESGRYTVSAEKFASLSVRPLPDAACCSQPHLVWYEPIMPLTGRRVGYTESASVAVGAAWQRGDENSAFYGRFDR